MPTWLDYMGIANQQRYAQQDQQMKLQMYQQAQQDRQRQQAAMTAAGNALPQLMPGGQPAMQPQMPPPPQPPAPGQPSQPMQPPGPPQGQMAPPPQPQNGGGVPLPPGQPGQQPPPIPPGGVQGQMPQAGLPPFKPMPTQPPPQQQAAPQSIAPPPQPAPQQQQGGPLTLQSAIKVLQDQGLSGADLMAGLQQLTPLLDAQSKQQAALAQAQFNQQFKLAQLDQTAEYHKGMLESKDLDRAQRAQHESALLGIQQQRLGIEQQSLGLRAAEIKQKFQENDDAKLTPEEAKLLAQQSLTGDNSGLVGLGRGAQGARNLVMVAKQKLALAKDQGMTGADLAANTAAFQGEKAAARTGAVKSTNIAMASSEANKMADQALALSSQIARTNAPTVNAGLNALRKQGGDPQIAAFTVANNGLKNTYSRAISPTGTPTVHDKQHADELFSLDQSPAQYAASIAQARKEMTAAQQAPAEVMAGQKARISGRNTEAAPAIPQGWTVTEH